MNVNPVSVHNPIIRIKEIINTKSTSAALAALLLFNPLGARNKAQAENAPSQTVTYNTQTSLDDYRIVPNSDFYYEVLNTNGIYKTDIYFTPGMYDGGAYYKYGDKTFDVQGNEIQNPEKIQTGANFSQESSSHTQIEAVDLSATNTQKTDFERLYALYGDKYKVEIRHNDKIGTYYTYAGKNFDEKGNMITVPQTQIIQNQTDLDRIYAIYGDKFTIEVKYNEKIGNYYSYAGRAYSLDGKEITLPKTQTPPEVKTNKNLTDFDRYYETYGNRYEIEVKYNDKVGYYYSYAGRSFSLEGKEITISSSGSSKSSNSSSSSKSGSSSAAKKTSNPRVKSGSDFDSYYSYYGNKYEIKSHWDHNIGAYYQYGPYAFTKEGKLIDNPEKLYRFNANVK